MNISKIGLGLLITGIAAALIGTIFYQNALTGVITQIELFGSAGAYLLNMQYMAILAICGVLLTILGVGFTFSNKKD